ncbi:hypothetical protein ACQEU8_06765 [Streptomyces sp. CA-250714]|uniref:hypothetical protein n=1 Tax=Streptomyces sp. CA-250714 TaxID=3240060 RepID=UPI003D9240CE
MGEHDSDKQMVNSPLYADLLQLRQSVAAQQSHIAATLDRAASDMGGGGVWEGPVAKTFATEIEGRKGEAHSLAQDIVDAVDAVLKQTPKQVTAAQARAYRKAV